MSSRQSHYEKIIHPLTSQQKCRWLVDTRLQAMHQITGVLRDFSDLLAVSSVNYVWVRLKDTKLLWRTWWTWGYESAGSGSCDLHYCPAPFVVMLGGRCTINKNKGLIHVLYESYFKHIFLLTINSSQTNAGYCSVHIGNNMCDGYKM